MLQKVCGLRRTGGAWWCLSCRLTRGGTSMLTLSLKSETRRSTGINCDYNGLSEDDKGLNATILVLLMTVRVLIDSGSTSTRTPYSNSETRRLLPHSHMALQSPSRRSPDATRNAHMQHTTTHQHATCSRSIHSPAEPSPSGCRSAGLACAQAVCGAAHTSACYLSSYQ
jgi:hypothetical protein